MHFIAWLFNSLEYLFLNFFVKKDSIERFFLSSVCWQIYLLTIAFRSLSKRLNLFFKMLTPSCFPFRNRHLRSALYLPDVQQARWGRRARKNAFILLQINFRHVEPIFIQRTSNFSGERIF